MADQPILELDGDEYERRGGAWVKARTHSLVSSALASRLNTLAKSRAELWDEIIDEALIDFNRTFMFRSVTEVVTL